LCFSEQKSSALAGIRNEEQDDQTSVKPQGMENFVATIVKIAIAILISLWMGGLAGIFWWIPVESVMQPTIRLAGTWTTVCIAAGSAFVALHQLHVSERWKRAEAARDMLDKVLSDPDALRALHMVDIEEGEIFASGDESFSVSADDIRTGLSEWDQQNAKCRLIRRSFQGLGFYLARLNLFMEKGYVDEDTILPFFTIHAQPLAELEPNVSEFYKRVGYVRAARFMQRIVAIVSR
jgi:hypothetical protein